MKAPPSSSDNSFHLLIGAQAFLDEVRHAVAETRVSCFAQFMTYEGDESGQGFSRMLAAKAAEGAEVRLIVDSYTDVILSDIYPSELHRAMEVQEERARTHEMFDWLRSRGVRVMRTAPIGPLGCYMPYRNHKKMVILDERVAFIGGINISDHNYRWHDFMVRIEGPLVRELARDFLSTWEGETVDMERPDHAGDFVLNQCAGRYSILDEVITLIECAESSLVIESPYLLGDRMEGALLAAAIRGVKVTIILPRRSNRLIYRMWMRTLRRRLAHPNVSVYGYHGHGNMTHAKLFLADGKRASFGSFNMIELEGLTQKELNVFTSNPGLIAQLETMIADDLSRSTILSTPGLAPGRFSYSALHRLFRWWTGRLLEKPAWRRIYC